MITQAFSLGSMVAEFGSGDIAIGYGVVDEGNKVAITLQTLEKECEIGSKTSDEIVRSTPVIMVFDKVESLNVLKEITEKAISALTNMLDPLDKVDPYFVVPFDKIFIKQSFKRSVPAYDKIIETASTFAKTGEYGKIIEVNQNLTLTDGYVAYIVGGYNQVEKMTVKATDGIKIKFTTDSDPIVFKSNVVKLAYKVGVESDALEIGNCGNVYVVETDDPLAVINKISSIFNAEFYVNDDKTKTFLDEKGIKYSNF